MAISISKQDLVRLARIVEETTGNHVQEKNFSTLESRIQNRMLKVGIHSIEEYWTYFKTHEMEERVAFQSLMTTHYTFFFREFSHFELVENWLEQNIKQIKERYNTTKQPVRVWSAACSRGHEVYSLAIFLEVHLKKKYGIPYVVLGTDLDPQSVEYAKNGVYPLVEVNAIPKEYLDGFWKWGTGQISSFAAITSVIKDNTQFGVANLLSLSEAGLKPESFDFIFCRNVFIYFTEEKIRFIAQDLSKYLKLGGILFSGLSEPLRFEGWSLKSLGPSAYQKPAILAQNNAPNVDATRSEKLTTVPEISSGYSVLCVDDSPTILALLKKIFSTDPLCKNVETAGNGKEARLRLDRGKFDVMTLDIHMPEVNGIEFLQNLYKRKQDPPVIMISSVNRTDIDLATKAMSLGAFDYVEKPSMNNIQKSADEILVKVSLARRKGKADTSLKTEDFDKTIARKTVIPDASLCMRIILATDNTLSKLKVVIEGQKDELRSPPTLVVFKKDKSSVSIEAEILKWTQRPIISLKGVEKFIKPNAIYVLDSEVNRDFLSLVSQKKISMQILSDVDGSFDFLRQAHVCQVLLDESLSEQQLILERKYGIKISDMTPATSFSSLSLEFFASLRNAA